MFDLAQLKAEHFESLIEVGMPIADSDFALTLKAVDRLQSPSPRGEPFSLIFAAPARTRGEQGVYHLQHPLLGVLAMFLVPIASPDGQPRFEAVFN